MKQQLVTAGIISAVGLTGAVGVTSVSAMAGDGLNGENGMVTRLVERFNLDEGEVTSFFEEQRAERQANSDAKQAERLAEAVNDGTLTQEQADLIEEKTAENKAEHEANMDSDLTREERQVNRTEHRAEMKAWVEENDIPESFMDKQYQGHKHGGGREHGLRGDNL